MEAMTQNENYVVWAEDDDDVDVQQLFSVVSDACGTSSTSNTVNLSSLFSDDKENNENNNNQQQQEPLSLFHPKRRKMLLRNNAITHKMHQKTVPKKELSPYTSNMNKSMQHRRLQRSQRKSSAAVVLDTTDHYQKKPSPKQEEKSDPFGDLLDLDDCDFAAMDDLVLQQQTQQTQQQIVDLFDELPDEHFFESIVDPSEQEELFYPQQLPLGFKNPLAAAPSSASALIFSRYFVAHVLTQQDQMHLFLHPEKPFGEKIIISQCKQVLLRGEWFYNHVECGDIIHIVSPSGRWRTDFCSLPILLSTLEHEQDDLLLVVDPDVLIAPTLISEALGCSRRAVLKQRMGSGPFSNKFAVFGTLRHALFQMCMLSQDFYSQTIKRYISLIVRNHAETILAAGLTDEEAIEETSQFIIELQRFESQYFSPHPTTNTFYTIAGVHSIEESAVSPELGLKGNVDALVNVVLKNNNNNNNNLMGMELKTNQNQNTNQAHVLQLSLYTLMLQARYHSSVGSGGILVYLNNQGQKSVHITPTVNETKSLIQIRNRIVYETKLSFVPRGVVVSNDNDNVEILPASPPLLPLVIPSVHSCNYCYSNSHCMLYVRSDMELVNDNDNNNYDAAIRKSHSHLLHHFTGQLTNGKEFDYFRNWDRMIDLEAQEYKNGLVQAWLRSSMELEIDTQTCISSVTWDDCTTSNNDTSSTVLTFDRHDAVTTTSLTSLNIHTDDIVVVSTDGSIYKNSDRVTTPFRHKVHIVRGRVHSVTNGSICIVASEQDWAQLKRVTVLWRKTSNDRLFFRIDKDEISTGAALLRQNLANLFVSDVAPFSMDIQTQQQQQQKQTSIGKRLERLRNNIIHFSTEPRFDEQQNMFSAPPEVPNVPYIHGCDFTDLCMEYFELNSDQQKAVQKIIAAKDYALMHGLPGSGKSHTIAFATRLLVARGCRVLITSYTHSAVDNMLMKIMEAGMGLDKNKGDIIRIGKAKQCLPGVHSILATSVALAFEQAANNSEEEISSPSCNSLRSVMSRAKVVGVSALTAPKSSLLVGQHFDVVIVDEAGQICQPAILGPLMAADRFVLVGDHMQLPPLTKSKAAESAGYGISMMKRLADAMPVAISRLSLQYRMHKDICELCNEIVYKGTLQCANEQVSTALLTLDNFPNGLPTKKRPITTTTSSDQDWLARIIDPRCVVLFADTDRIVNDDSSIVEGTGQKSSSSHENTILFSELEKSAYASGARIKRGGVGGVTNLTEVDLIRQSVTALVRCGLSASDIGVISPLRSQVRLLEDDATLCELKTHKGLEISTIDKYQGRDKVVILISLVRSNFMGKCGSLLNDFRRLNVAVSRAKRKLIFFGSCQTLHKGSETFRPILGNMKSKGWLFLLPPDACLMYESSYGDDDGVKDNNIHRIIRIK